MPNEKPETEATEPSLPDVGETIPPIDFTTFVLSLSTSVLMNLGLVPGPDGSRVEPSLPMARQTIDLISLLQEKTRGNLTGAEEQILGQILFDLRMRFIEKAGRPSR